MENRVLWFSTMLLDHSGSFIRRYFCYCCGFRSQFRNNWFHFKIIINQIIINDKIPDRGKTVVCHTFSIHSHIWKHPSIVICGCWYCGMTRIYYSILIYSKKKNHETVIFYVQMVVLLNDGQHAPMSQSIHNRQQQQQNKSVTIVGSSSWKLEFPTIETLNGLWHSIWWRIHATRHKIICNYFFFSPSILSRYLSMVMCGVYRVRNILLNG